jgi:hypothetical protein
VVGHGSKDDPARRVIGLEEVADRREQRPDAVERRFASG